MYLSHYSFDIKCDTCIDGVLNTPNTDTRFSLQTYGNSMHLEDVDFYWEFKRFPSDEDYDKNFCAQKQCYPFTLLIPCGRVDNTPQSPSRVKRSPSSIIRTNNFNRRPDWMNIRSPNGTMIKIANATIKTGPLAPSKKVGIECNSAASECANFNFEFRKCDFGYTYQDMVDEAKRHAEMTTKKPTTSPFHTTSAHYLNRTTTSELHKATKGTAVTFSGVNTTKKKVKTSTTPLFSKTFEKLTTDALERFRDGSAMPTNINSENLPYKRNREMVLVLNGFKQGNFLP